MLEEHQNENGQEGSLEFVVILSLPHSWFNLTRVDQVMVAEATTYQMNVSAWSRDDDRFIPDWDSQFREQTAVFPSRIRHKQNNYSTM